MNENDASPEIIKENKEGYLEKIITGLMIFFALGGGIADVTIQPYLQNLKEIGEITALQDRILTHFLNNIGDVTNGFLFGALALYGDLFLNLLDKEETNKLILEIRKILPFIICTIMFAWIIDVETVQLTGNIPLIKNIIGHPDVKDLYAGFFGIVAGARLFEMYREAREIKSNN